MPCMKSSGLAFPFAISVSVFSHSAVSFGEVRLSGRTQTRLIPFFVGKSCLPLRSTKPEFTSFSMTAARVAGVPNPLRSASAFVSSLPACSIADKRLASVWGFGGCVSWAVTFVEKPENVCPSVKSGTSDTKSLSPSSASGFPFSVRR